MKNISGVEFKRDVSGKAKSVTIDLQKHGEALQFFLEQVGALSEEENFEKNGLRVFQERNWSNVFTPIYAPCLGKKNSLYSII